MPKQKILKYNAEDQEIEWSNSSSSNAFHRSFSFGRNSFEVKSIQIDDITEVCRGVQTDVLLRAGLVDPLCCLSIVTADRTVDITTENAFERDSIIRALQQILANKAVKFL